MTVFIQLTTAGTDTGPFDLYSDASVPAYCCSFAINVTRQQLIDGYAVTAPDNTTTVKVFSKGKCAGRSVLIPTGITTTSTSSTSSTSSTTTSTTTSDFNISAAYNDSFAACGKPFVQKVYYSGTLVALNTIYTNPAMTSVFVGNVKYYLIKGDANPWQIGSDGKLIHAGFCTI